MKVLLTAAVLTTATTAVACVPQPPPGVTCHQAVDLIFPPQARARFHRIVTRESGGRADAQNKSSSAAGCGQTTRVHAARYRKLGYSWADRYNAWVNIRVCHDLWLEQGWRPWRLTA